MDAFLAKLSYHATSYAIRSCLALTSTYVIQQSSRLLKTVDDDPLRAELCHLQRRLARKIELISPILESIEFRYTRGNTALEAVVRTAQELRTNVDSLGKRLEVAALADDSLHNAGPKTSAASPRRRIEVQSIITDIKQLITDIDDTIPLINLWVSAMGGIQTQTSAFSPSRLLQASMLVNVGDMQYILNPGQPMQIGPDFMLSIYMLFQAHTFGHSVEPYGVEEGQRKPMWQEVIHKARVRLCRMPLDEFPGTNSLGTSTSDVAYAYQLQIVEDLDDGRVHTFENGQDRNSYDGIPLAGIREFIPVHQLSKMFYADVGRILNINNEDGASSNPVLLLKRDVNAVPPNRGTPTDTDQMDQLQVIKADESISSDGTLEGDSQDEVNCQLQLECEASEAIVRTTEEPHPKKTNIWRFPQELDPEWIALEVFEMDNDNDTDTTDEEDEPTPEAEEEDERQDKDGNDDNSSNSIPHHLKRTLRPSADSNLVTQLNRMSIASRPSSVASDALIHDFNTSDENLLEQSPFGAIHTSLSLLEMLLRLTSLQEFEQTTHLAIPDHVLRFYLDESASRGDGDVPVHHGVNGSRSS
ncbi:Ran-binding-domain-containing protein [Hypoxylon crocopeplum]|nr:Ran-binding-domain-containing protein [Hypoxylon crocopeplum]